MDRPPTDVVADDARLGAFALAQRSLQFDGNGPVRQLKKEPVVNHIPTVRVDHHAAHPLQLA